MAFKKKAVVNARLDGMSKKQLIATIKTLRKRETALLNQVAKLEEKVHDYERIVVEADAPPASGVEMDATFERIAASTAPVFPWEVRDALQASRRTIITSRAKATVRDDAGNGNNQTECTESRKTFAQAVADAEEEGS